MPHNADKTLIQFLLTIVFVIVVAIFNWIKRRSESEEPADTGSERKFPPPIRPARPPAHDAAPPTVPRPAARQPNWEEELRRLVEGRKPAPSPQSGRAHEEPRHAPAPPPLLTSPPVLAPRPAPIRPIVVEQERGLPVELAGLTNSAQTYEEASQLDEKMAEHLRQIGQQVQRHSDRPQASVASVEIAQALALVRTRQTLRSVIMASIILGPPKALES